jgi:hypothetical protein
MRLLPVFFVILIATVGNAQPPLTPARIPIDSSEVPSIAAKVSERSEHLTPMFEQVHISEWIAKGAPDTYNSQWNSLVQQNQAIETDMKDIAEHPERMQDVMHALFRVHRFDIDLNALLIAVRRYQNPALADIIESAAVSDQAGVEKLQQYALDLADVTEKQLSIEDEEAQRCRGSLASQPPVRTAAPKKTNGTSK